MPQSWVKEQNTSCSWFTKSRYTFFIVAYPAGVTGELLCSYSAMLYSKTLDHKKILFEMIPFFSRFWEGPSLRPPSKCAQCHVLLPPGHPRHHAPLHPPLPPHVPPHVHPEEEGPGHRPQDRLVLLFGETIAAFALFLSGWRDTVMWVSVWSVIRVNVYEIKQGRDMLA